MPSAPTPDPTESIADPIETVAALGDPNRRKLYDHVVEANGWVGRDAAAEAICALSDIYLRLRSALDDLEMSFKKGIRQFFILHGKVG